MKFLKITFREKENWFWIFGYPLLFMVLFSVAFNSGSSRSSYNIAIVNYDTNGLDNLEINMGANDIRSAIEVKANKYAIIAFNIA